MNNIYWKNGGKKPRVLILGSNFGGLTTARLIRSECKDKVDITVIDKKPYLLFVPNIPLEVLRNENPQTNLQMDFISFLKDDQTNFLQAEVCEIDVISKSVKFIPTERPGAAYENINFDYLVIALGCKLDYNAIKGFGEYGHTLSDTFYGNKLREYLFGGHYKGGPIAIGSARFQMGSKGKPDFIPIMESACEGPTLEVSMGLSSLLEDKKWGGPKNISIFTPGEWVAEDAGIPLVKEFLHMACDEMGMKYVNNTYDIKEVTKDGIEFVNGPSVEAELKIIFPNWAPHNFMKQLPIVDEYGFVITDLHMRNPDYPNIFAVGDCAALTAPKLGGLGDQQARIVAKEIAIAVGAEENEIDRELIYNPVIMCFGDMGHHKAFYLHSNLIYGGNTAIMKMGHMFYAMKIGFKDTYFMTGGKTPGWGIKLTELIGG